MMKIKEKNIPQNQQEKERVIKYLYKHPNLFNENPELLEFLSPPSLKKNNILDMQEFLIGSLQKNCQNLRSKNNFLVDLSKENLQNQEKIHNAILKILSTESFNDFIKKILIELPKILSIDQIFLCFQAPLAKIFSLNEKNIIIISEEKIKKLISTKPCVLINNMKKTDLKIFEAGKEDFKSFAILRISSTTKKYNGLLVLASKKKSTFEPTKGTLLLEFLSKSISHCFSLWLKN